MALTWSHVRSKQHISTELLGMRKVWSIAARSQESAGAARAFLTTEFCISDELLFALLLVLAAASLLPSLIWWCTRA